MSARSSGHPKRPPRHAPLVFEALEPRVLLSADLAGALGLDNAGVVSAAASESSASAVIQSSVVQSAVVAAQTQRLELVFVDASVSDVDRLISDLLAQSDAERTLRIYTLDTTRDGLQQIAEVLRSLQDQTQGQTVDAIHLITHGDARGVQIGGTWLTADNVWQYASQIGNWSLKLSAEADVLLYGCDLAASAQGQRLVEDIALLSGADVAASTNLTGAASAGGDWVLEHQQGLIETTVAANAATQAQWQGTLLMSASGSESLVNTSTSGTQSTTTNRQVATDGSGNYVVIWQKSNTLYGQRFDSSGTKLGSEFTLSTSGALFSTVSNPQVAMNASGAFVVTWYEYNPGLLGIILPSWTVYMQRFNASGSSLGVTQVFDDLAIITFSGDPQMYSSVAMDDSGNIAVATRNDDEVRVEWYGSSGSQTGSARVDSGSSSTKTQVSVAMSTAGTVITWTDSGTEIYGQLYNASRVAVGGNFHVNTTTTGTQTLSSVGMDASGNFVVSWSSTQNGTSDIYAQRFSSAGVKQGSEFQANTTSTDTQTNSSVAVDSSSGAFVIAWQSNLQDGSGTGIYARQYQADGFAGLYDVQINTTSSGAQGTPSVAFRGSQAVVAWCGNGSGDSGGVFAQRLSVGANQAPTLALGATTLNYTENAGAVALIGSATVADTDNTVLQGAVVQISSGFVSGEDVLSFASMLGITGAWNASTGTLTLTGTALKSSYQQALRSITYTNTSDNPSAVARTVSVIVSDGQLDSSTATLTLNVQAVNDAPTVSAAAAVSMAQSITSSLTGITVADADAASGLLTLTLTVPSTDGSFAGTAGSTAFVTVGGNGVDTLTLQGTASDINAFIAAGNIAYTSAIAGSTTLSLSVDDGGNSGSGGALMGTRLVVITAASVTLPTVSVGGTVAATEDTAAAISGVSVSAPDAGSSAVQLTLTVGSGTLLAASGGGVSASGSGTGTLVLVGSVADINVFMAAAQVSFVGATDASGSVVLTATFNDLANNAAGVALQDQAVGSIAVAAVNDAPQGANATISTPEDVRYVFGLGDFSLTDASDSPAHALSGVVISTLPSAGTLLLSVSGSFTAVIAGQTISRADLDAGHLVYASGTDASGTGYASFTFRVQDDGGTADGGVDTDATARTITIDVSAVNDAPVGTSTTVTLLEDGSYSFGTADFGFTDPSDTPADTFTGVLIGNLPSHGALTLSGVAVQSGDVIAAASLSALVYTPDADGNGAAFDAFTFAVQDSGGTASGGVDTDTTWRTLTLSVTAVNDAPQASGGTLTVGQSMAYTLTVADFGFADASDQPANALQAVRIASLPTHGTLTLSGAAVSALQVIAASDIAAGLLVFTPDGQESGLNYATFSYQVQDDGGTAHGGQSWSSGTYALSVDVITIINTGSDTEQGGGSGGGAGEGTVDTPSADTSLEAAAAQATNARATPGSAVPPQMVAAMARGFAEFDVRGLSIDVVAGSRDVVWVDRAASGGSDGTWFERANNIQPLQWLLDQIQGNRLARSDGGAPTLVSTQLMRWSDADGEQTVQAVEAGVKTGSVAVSVGMVWWATRLSGLMTGLMASTPAWRTLDPLPIVGSLGADDASSGGPDDEFEDDGNSVLGDTPGARARPHAGDLFAYAPDTVPLRTGDPS